MRLLHPSQRPIKPNLKTNKHACLTNNISQGLSRYTNYKHCHTSIFTLFLSTTTTVILVCTCEHAQIGTLITYEDPLGPYLGQRMSMPYPNKQGKLCQGTQGIGSGKLVSVIYFYLQLL